jgi:hypothetical protein
MNRLGALGVGSAALMEFSTVNAISGEADKTRKFWHH